MASSKKIELLECSVCERLIKPDQSFYWWPSAPIIGDIIIYIDPVCILCAVGANSPMLKEDQEFIRELKADENANMLSGRIW